MSGAPWEAPFLEEANGVRVRCGLKRLRWDEKLAAMARGHAINLAGRGFFSLKNLVLGDLDSRLVRHEIEAIAAGGNLFMAQGCYGPGPAAIEY